MKKYWYTLVVFLALVGCFEEPEVDIPDDVVEDEFLIEVPSDFSWACIKSNSIVVNFKKQGIITNDLDNTLVELYDEDVLLDALTVIEGQAEFNVRIPEAVEMLTLVVVAADESVEIDPDASTVDYNVQDLSGMAFAKIDSDNDGLYDAFDVDPENSAVTAVITNDRNTSGLKSASGKKKSSASYAIFEDLWPSKGDYDFNDLVVKSAYSWVRGKKNYVESIQISCEVEFVGAGMNLGLGYELFELKGSKLRYLDNVITEVTNGVEDESVQNGIIAFSAIKNTATKTFEITIKVKEKSFKNVHFIPYLFRTNEPSHQVRPFGAPPTQAQDMSLFSIRDDASPRTWDWSAGTQFKYPLKGTNAFYRSAQNHPWSIEFITKKKFKPCSESITILKEYPDFREWAESGGVNRKDWYENPSE